MFEEVIVPVKKKEKDGPAESDSLADNQEKYFQPENQADEDIYQKELQPLVRLFVPAGENPGKFEADLFTELKSNVELLADRSGRLVVSPEESLAAMKNILSLKAKELISRYDQCRYSEKKIDISLDDVKKAKIFLLANHDFSDWNKKHDNKIDSSAEDAAGQLTENVFYDHLASYLGMSTYYDRSEQGKYPRLNSDEAGILCAAGFKDQLLKLARNYNDKIFSEVPEEIFLDLAKDEQSRIDPEIFLQRAPDQRGYSEALAKELVRGGYGRYVLRYPKAFKEGCDLEHLKYVIRNNNPGYPYHLDETLREIDKTPLMSLERQEAIDYAFKHNFVTDRTSYEITGLSKYKKMDDYLKVDTDYGSLPALEKISPDKLAEMKKMVGEGYMTMFYDYNRFEYLKYLAKNDYEWLVETARRYDQENLLFKGKPPLLSPQDQVAYAEKLMASGDQAVLVRAISQDNLIEKAVLPQEIFWDLFSQGYKLSPRYFKDLDDNCLDLYQQKMGWNKPGNNDTAIFQDIGYFGLKPGMGHENFRAYQSVANLVKDKFGSVAPEVFRKLNLAYSQLPNQEIMAAKEEEIRQKLAAVEEALSDYSLGGLSQIINLSFLGDKTLAGVSEDANNLKLLAERRVALSDNKLQLMSGRSAAENSQLIELLRLESQPLNNLLRNFFEMAAEPESEKFQALARTISSDFGVNPASFVAEGRLDQERFLASLNQSIADNYRRYLPDNNNLDAVKEGVLAGSVKIENNDLFTRLASKYLNDRNYAEEIHSFDVRGYLHNAERVEKFTDQNWAQAFMSYALAMEAGEFYVDKEFKQWLEDLFAGPYRDVCIGSMNREWREFLADKEQENLPFKLEIISSTVDNLGGAGNLSRFETFSNFIYSTGQAMKNEKTAPRTKAEIKDILAAEEARFEREHFSQDDKNEFYGLAKEILEAAPSLLAAFKPVLDQMSGKEMKSFLKEVMPLYQINLITIQKETDKDGEVKYNPRDLLALRKRLEEFAANLSAETSAREAVFSSEKEELEKMMRLNFRDRLGIQKIPEHLDREGLRSLHNFIRYTGNINGRDANKEAIISLFLSLQLNGDWQQFRQGKMMPPAEYLSADKAALVKEALAGREQNSLSADKLDIKPRELAAFQEKLQSDTAINMIGNIETVDVKLGNIKRNVDELLDLDTYEDELDRSLIPILSKNNKAVGAVLAKTFQFASGRNVSLNAEELTLQNQLAEVFGVADWTAENVKAAQDRLQPLSLINNLAKKLEESRVEENIADLNRRLEPSREIIDIFNRLDENFKPESGALAISRDLDYLEGLIVKAGEKISPKDREAAVKYLSSIREKMAELERIMSSTKEYFDKIRSSSHASLKGGNARLNDRLQEIEKIINAQDDSSMIVSEMTNDPNAIIENMRQCLGCLRKEINNDTNLAFGDDNKFFLTSRKEKNKGSLADEIVFLLPVKQSEDKETMSFVMDRVYGSKSADILLAHILTVYKKFSGLKDNFGKAKLSIAVTNEALSSAGIDAETMKKRLAEKEPRLKRIEYLSGLVAEVPKSSFSDNYLEFGTGSARTAGPRNFSALVIE